MLSMFDANRLFLNAMEVSHVATIILAIGLPFHCILAYSLVFKLRWGVYGLALAINITYTGFLAAITGYSCLTKNDDVRKSWFWPSKESFKDWGRIFALGVPSSVMYFVDWSSFEILALMSGILGVEELSTVGIILVCAPFFESFAFGMQMTVVVFISNAIGAQKIEEAKTFVKACVIMALIANIISTSIICLYRTDIAFLFSEDPIMIEMMPRAICFFCIFMFWDMC